MPSSLRPGLAEKPVVFLAILAIASLAIEPVGYAQKVEVRDAPQITMPAQVDSNSPAYWLNGDLHIVNSTGNGPYNSRGQDQFHQAETQKVRFKTNAPMPTWIEAVWMDSTGILFGWYHQEDHTICLGANLSAPRIGAAVSFDGGASFTDLGTILESGDPLDCGAQNGYFAGGHGDFSVVPDREGTFFYFLFSNYGGPRHSQGIVVARMAFQDRFSPVGRVWKYFEGNWNQPGMVGSVTPIFPAKVEWQRPDTNAFWGPSVHWNNYLGAYVMLLNHSCCSPGWPQKDVRISFSTTLSDPSSWSQPKTIVEGGGWYPQILGLGPEGTDSVSGKFARLYMYGQSTANIVFHRGDESAGESEGEAHN